jgi:hypothetical protein
MVIEIMPPPSLLQPVPEFPGDLPLDVPFPDICPLVVGFFALAEAQFNLDPAFFKIKRKGNQGIALFLGLPGDALDLIPVEEEPFFPIRVVVKD